MSTHETARVVNPSAPTTIGSGKLADRGDFEDRPAILAGASTSPARPLPGAADKAADEAADEAALFARVAARYGGCGRGARGFVGGKLRHDPVHRAVLERARAAPFGDVVDLGCGRGQMGILLLEAGLARSVLGVDRAGWALGQAARAGSGLAFRAARCDLAAPPPLPPCDTVLLIDVLYQLAPSAQSALLGAAAGAARRAVLIRTLDPARGWRSALTIGFEQMGRLRRLRPLHPPRIETLAAILLDHGFGVGVAPCWRGTPFANVLLTARRTVQPDD